MPRSFPKRPRGRPLPLRAQALLLAGAVIAVPAMPASAQAPAWLAALRAVPVSLPPKTDAWTWPTPQEVVPPALPLPPLPAMPLIKPPPTLPEESSGAADKLRAAERAAVLKARDIADPAVLNEAIDAYREGGLAKGDALASRFKDRGVRALLEWLALRRNTVSFERLLTFIESEPEWPGNGALRRRAEQRLLSEPVAGARVRAFFLSQEPATAAGKIALALCLRGVDLGDEAAALIRDVWRRSPLSPELEARLLQAFGNRLTTEDHRLRMERLLFANSGSGALRAAARLGPAETALAKARLAANGQAKKAAAMLAALPESVSNEPSARFAKAQMLRKQGKLVDAVRMLAGVPTDPAKLGDGDAWWTERRLLMRALLDADIPAAAYDVARHHGAESASNRIEAEFHAGWIALRFLGDAKAATAHFAAASAVSRTPISKARADYWQARALDEAGNGEEARALYSSAASRGIAYYGQLARGRLGEPAAALRKPAQPTFAAQIAFGLRPAAQAVELLEAINEKGLALILYRDFTQQSQDEGELSSLAALARRHGHAAALLAVGKTATQRGFPLEAEAFPTMGVPSASPRPGVDQAMILAIARQESAFDPQVISPAGARGLMQLMPATARATARQAGLSYEPDRLTSDAAYNADLGAAHLSDLIRNWKGSYILAFAAYNAGGGNVAKWVRAYGDPRQPGIDPVDWVERIPFAETRNYVQRVMENLQVYRHRLAERPVALSEAALRAGIAAR